MKRTILIATIALAVVVGAIAWAQTPTPSRLPVGD
jgi:hypothetical protein